MSDSCRIKIVVVEHTAKNPNYKDLVAIQVTGGAPKVLLSYPNIHPYKTKEAFKWMNKELSNTYDNACVTKV